MSRRRPTATVRGPKPAQAVLRVAGAEGEAPRVKWAGAKGSARGLVQRSTGEAYRVVAYLPPDLGRELRVHCAAQLAELSGTVTAAVRQWLAGGGALASAEVLERVRAVASDKGLSEGAAVTLALEQWCARADKGKR